MVYVILFGSTPPHPVAVTTRFFCFTFLVAEIPTANKTAQPVEARDANLGVHQFVHSLDRRTRSGKEWEDGKMKGRGMGKGRNSTDTVKGFYKVNM